MSDNNERPLSDGLVKHIEKEGNPTVDSEDFPKSVENPNELIDRT